jgi:hypothetical protein
MRRRRDAVRASPIMHRLTRRRFVLSPVRTDVTRMLYGSSDEEIDIELKVTDDDDSDVCDHCSPPQPAIEAVDHEDHEGGRYGDDYEMVPGSADEPEELELNSRDSDLDLGMFLAFVDALVRHLCQHPLTCRYSY